MAWHRRTPRCFLSQKPGTEYGIIVCLMCDVVSMRYHNDINRRGVYLNCFWDGARAGGACGAATPSAKHVARCVPSHLALHTHAENKIAGCRIIPFLVLGFWDKNIGICAGAMPYRRDFPDTTRILSFQAKKGVILCRRVEISVESTTLYRN